MKNKSKHIFNSKALVLEFLQKKIKKSSIEKIMYFTVEDWKTDQKKLLYQIKKTFSFSEKIIIRSSALGEDSTENSFAGAYSSILGISPKSETSIKNGIKNVIKSYESSSNFNPKNQILIQNQTKSVYLSGVVFTRTTESGAPYYIINYELGGTTTKTTQGISNKVLKVYRNTKTSKLNKNWKLLLSSIKELEKVCNSDYLDIEFCITNSQKVIIFQVRPITTIESDHNLHLTNFSQNIDSIKKKYSELTKKRKNIPGKTTIFSDMSDWNPSEIIGNNPNNLDYSLYEYLITNSIWHESRTFLGYQDVKPYELMVKFGNKPYIDLRGSFNSLTPKNIPRKIIKKLINFYFSKLIQNPHLHDKVEFEILFTCYDFTINERLKELKKYNFSSSEISQIKKCLCDFTKNILLEDSKIFLNCKSMINVMMQNRNQILQSTNHLHTSHQKYIDQIEILLNDCKNLGAYPFAIMARLAFVGTILLKSFQHHSNSKTFFENYIQSLTTPLTEIQNDLIDYKNNKITKQEFMDKYGHLRPGTYDITQLTYANNDEFLSDIKFLKKSKISKFYFNDTQFTKLLSKELNIKSDIDVMNFISTVIVEREKLKFEFTKNLSLALELIAELGKKLGFTREDLSYLEIKSIIKSKHLSKSQLISNWKKEIHLNKKYRIINNNLILPQIIFSKNDFDVVIPVEAKPNYITNKIIKNRILELKDFTTMKLIKNSILLIENADPGFDWIFTKKPAGLITKYGGVASHMSIRCAEIGLPAAIGCGEILYEQLRQSSKIQLDCKNQQIFVLEHKKTDYYLEERKILKSLGYIK